MRLALSLALLASSAVVAQAAPTEDLSTARGATAAKLQAVRYALEYSRSITGDEDATKAKVTIGRCARDGRSWLCDVELAPVRISGVSDLSCALPVRVGPRRTGGQIVGCR